MSHKSVVFLGISMHICFFFFGCAGSSLLCGLVSSCGEQRLLSGVCKLLIAITSLVAEHGLCGAPVSVAGACGLSNCGSRARVQTQ